MSLFDIFKPKEKKEEQDNKNQQESPTLNKPKEEKSGFSNKLNQLMSNFREVDENFFEELEEILIEADVGYRLSFEIVEQLRKESLENNLTKNNEVKDRVIKILVDKFNNDIQENNIGSEEETDIYLFVGVNGVGKTTSVGKLANKLKNQGKKVLLVAADTFRAGAIEQLKKWSERSGVDIIYSKQHSDASSIVFDGLKKFKDENYDVILIDTAGRLQNKVNLMKELEKINKTINKMAPSANKETFIVIDSTTGQNGVEQVRLFNEITDITGIVLTKIDGSSKGGIILSISHEFHIPVRYVGTGEKIEDLSEFSSEQFTQGLFKELI